MAVEYDAKALLTARKRIYAKWDVPLPETSNERLHRLTARPKTIDGNKYPVW